jgi:hypothetical protein
LRAAILELIDSSMEDLLPMGEPRRMASLGSVTLIKGYEVKVESLVASSLQITSDFVWLNFKPSSFALSSIVARSDKTQSTGPPRVPSLR